MSLEPDSATTRNGPPNSSDFQAQLRAFNNSFVLERQTSQRLDKDYLTPHRPDLEGRRSSTASIAQLEQMVSDDKIDTDTYGVSELRDGFFDALFLKPSPRLLEDDIPESKSILSADFEKIPPRFSRAYAQKQWNSLLTLISELATTRDGIRLLKSFTAFFVAYILCLVPVIRDWLGRYSYVMVLSTIINHPARTVGSQIDGAILTTIGTAAGLGWGVVALLLSTSNFAASAGYGCILALFMAAFMAILAWLRSFFIRFYQGALCAGIAITFMTQAETNSRTVEWPKLRSYGIPWLLGQAIALAINCAIFPDAGARPLAIALHEFFNITQDALVIPRPRDARLRRLLSQAYVDLSTMYRDMCIDITITRFRPDDVRELRNQMLVVIRALLSLDTEINLFDAQDSNEAVNITINEPESSSETQNAKPSNKCLEDPSQNVIQILTAPTKDLLAILKEGLLRSDAALMDLSGYRKHIGPPLSTSSDAGPLKIRLQIALAAFDATESTVFDTENLSPSCPDLIQLFLFTRNIRTAAAAIQKLMDKVEQMQQISSWPRIYLPSYPFWKAIHRTNKQIRHDRGGITVGSYHRTFIQIERVLEKIKAREHKPWRTRANIPEGNGATEDNAETDSKQDEMGFKVWRVLHRLQGFESRYALKVCLVVSLLSIPSYLKGTDWWDRYEVWWAVSMSWIMIHPRVGGNLEDLIVRAFHAILGAVWSGAAYAAGKGNPFILAVFAAIYMFPMLYRFTQSSHPRSGLVGCFSFTVISLGLQNHNGDSATAVLAVFKGLSFFVGTIVPIIINWILWPFVARHELRFALSSMLFFMSIMYRSVVAKYVYFEQGHQPTSSDIKRSEILEGHLREGFVRIRQLLVLTRHEFRVRNTFDPVPYTLLADSSERFLDYLIQVRQSALFYNPGFVRDTPLAAEKLLGYRRDAVAAVLANLYILAGALRSERKVPKYLPSAAAARKKLLLRTIEIEEEMAEEDNVRQPKKYAEIYSYAYRESLTGCVAQLEELEKYTKLIFGEQGFDDDFKDEDNFSDNEG